jgi:phosphotriesterase-related protein
VRSDNLTGVSNPERATLIDEHVQLGPQGHGHWGARPDHAPAAAELRRLADAGIARIVDTTTIECGRDARLLDAMAAASGVEILCCTGLSASEAGVSTAFRDLRAERLADMFVSEIEGDPHAAAVIVETGRTHDDFDERAALAAAFAHAETGVPVLVRAHTATVVERVERLTSRGVDPERVLVLGLDRASTTWDTLDALGARGVALGLTSFGDPAALAQDARAALLAVLVRRFGAARVVLGSGTAQLITGPPGLPAEREPGDEALALLRAEATAFGVELAAVLDASALLDAVAVAS